jgi:hypothetical protein
VTERTTHVRWINRGKQKRAIAQVLTKPLTQSQLCALAQAHAPKLQLRDIWAIVGQWKQLGLIHCLNPDELTGKLHFWTDKGRTAVTRAFNMELQPLPNDFDWRLYAWVARGKLRRFVLLAVGNAIGRPFNKTAAEIRKAVRDKYPVGLNSTLRTLQELVARNVIEYNLEDNRRFYRHSPAGETIARELVR